MFCFKVQLLCFKRLELTVVLLQGAVVMLQASGIGSTGTSDDVMLEVLHIVRVSVNVCVIPARGAHV